jgi:hypothetical protein
MAQRLRSSRPTPRRQDAPRKETANRNMTMLRSALNYVYKHDWAATPRAWAAVSNSENTTGRRTLF